MKVLTTGILSNLMMRNRAVVAPMSRVSASACGLVNEKMVSYYRKFAEGGFAMIITEGTYTDNHYSKAYPNQPAMVSVEHAEAWEKVATAVKKEGANVVMQLMHAGALSQILDETIAPSVVKPLRHMLEGYSEKTGEYLLPKSASHEEIKDVISGFVNASILAKSAGFHGVEIHGANGYLFDQFLTEYTNKRDDSYGGDLAKRLCIFQETIREIRRQVGRKFVIGVRLSQGKVNDFDYKWPNAERAASIIFRTIEEAGADYIHFASEGAGFNHGSVSETGVSLPKLAKRTTKLPVIINGGLHDAAFANSLINECHGDFVSLGTGALANPDWPKRIESSRELNIFSNRMFEKGVRL